VDEGNVTRIVAKARKLFKVLRHADYRHARRAGKMWAGIEHERMLKTLDIATLVDVGANRGQFAVVMRHCFPQARIVSFEPLPVPATLFRNVFARDPLVTLHQVAVGKESCDATIHIAGADPASSLLPITNLQSDLFPGTSEVRTETVRVAPLNAVITRDEIVPPAMLKIDVQGYELNTLKGCESLLDAFNYVYIECSFMELYQGQALASEVCAHLIERGFRLDGVHNLHYNADGRAIQADFLFTKGANHAGVRA
jgi:FkbM family methyltransferase